MEPYEMSKDVLLDTLIACIATNLNYKNEYNELERRLSAGEAAIKEVETLRQENSAIHALMNSYNTGGWTDSIEPMKRALKAEKEVEQLKENYGNYESNLEKREAELLDEIIKLKEKVERLKAENANLKCCGNCAQFDDYGCKLREEGGAAPAEVCDEWVSDKLTAKERKS